VLGTTKSNLMSGHYFIALPVGKNYGYYVKKDGYYPTSNSIDLTKSKDGDSRKVDIELVSTKDMKTKSSSITINNIFFDFDSAILKKESTSELKRLVDFVQKNSIDKIKIIGHTDKVGSDKYNEKLSIDRAISVKKYISNSLPKLQITTIGKGATEPRDKTDDSKNRRVEIVVE
ncbi:MAG: OmpA family protein, partial [Candidatus Kapaibacterium sp.]